MEGGYQSFVCISSEDGSDDIMELPREKNGTLFCLLFSQTFPLLLVLNIKARLVVGEGSDVKTMS